MEATDGSDFSSSLIVCAVSEFWRYCRMRVCLARGGRDLGALVLERQLRWRWVGRKWLAIVSW